jgi:protein involved in polysaccharide export with SLBB domain
MSAVLKGGDEIEINFGEMHEAWLKWLKLRIATNGQITLHYNLVLVAAGKTAAELQKDIHDAYVPKLYRQLSVEVRGPLPVGDGSPLPPHGARP